MSAASSVLSEKQLLCSICEDVFTHPVTIPCGHNFCKNCITQHWDVNAPCQCPMCKELFCGRPELRVNTFISEMAAQFRKPAQKKSSSCPDQRCANPGEVPCDVCTVTKLKGLKSCLVCLTYCETHLEGTVRRAVAQLEETLSKEVELKRVQQYAVDVTLDPDTAHARLILSDDGKQVNFGDVKKNLPDNPERFSLYAHVLGKQSFSSGRFYYEVQVKGKTIWALGVARGSINRKGHIILYPQIGYWTIRCRNGNEYSAGADPSVRLSLKTEPQKVGVFVDYEEGLVSFYDVDAAALIYSYTGCTFTDKLHPYFSPCNNDGGKNSAPLIISPVNHTD